MRKRYVSGCKTEKYTSPEIQNEILKLMGLELLQNVISNIQNGVHYSIMCDEATDAAATRHLLKVG